MGVRPGYKQTEVGLIPEDWEVEGLLDAVKLANGQVDPRIEPFVAMPLIAPDHIESGTGRLITISTAKEQGAISGKYLFAPNDILYSKIRPHLQKAALVDFDGLCSADMYPMRPSNGVSAGYILSVLLAYRFTKYAVSVSVRSGMPKINRLELADFLLALPPLPEQTAIADALGDVDALLAGLGRLIAKKRNLKQAALHQLLTAKTRLPGFSGEWQVKRLGDIGDIRSGGTPSTTRSQFWNGSIPWCTPTDITALRGEKYLTETARTISRAGLKFSSAELIPPQSLIMTTRATIGECAINLVPMTTNQGFKNIIPFEGNSVEFLYYLMTTQKQGLIALCGGSTFLEISKKQLTAFKVNLPKDPEEQTAIAAVLSDMDAEITALERRLAKTNDLKQAMMQELLTGKTRLVGPRLVASRDKPTKPHNKAFNEAVVIAVLAQKFGSEQFPLGRKRYTKLAYLLHRHAEGRAEGYLKKAAGPYNPQTRYGGAEKIAVQNNYVREHKAGKYSGFIAAGDIAKARGYFEKWYGAQALQWLEQFRYKKNDALELLATVDMAVEDLRQSGQPVNVENIKSVIREHPEWQAKLDRAIFADSRIKEAMGESHRLFTQAPND